MAENLLEDYFFFLLIFLVSFFSWFLFPWLAKQHLDGDLLLCLCFCLSQRLGPLSPYFCFAFSIFPMFPCWTEARGCFWSRHVGLQVRRLSFYFRTNQCLGLETFRGGYGFGGYEVGLLSGGEAGWDGGYQTEGLYGLRVMRILTEGTW